MQRTKDEDAEIHRILRRENAGLAAFEEIATGSGQMALISVLGAHFEHRTPSEVLLHARESARLHAAFQDVLLETVGARPHCWLVQGGRESVVVLDASQLEIHQIAEAFAASLRAQFAQPMTLACGSTFFDLSALPATLDNALCYADFVRFLEGDMAFIDEANRVQLQQRIGQQYPGFRVPNYERTIISAILNGNLTHAEMITNYLIVSHLMDDIRVFSMLRDNIRNIVRLVMAFSVPSPRELALSDQRYEQIQGRIASCDTLRALQSLLRTFFAMMGEYTQANGTRMSAQRRLRDITEYINAHYADPMMCAKQVCGLFDVSLSYLSHSFKEQMGINLSTYLQLLRVEEAKRLLVTTDMTAEKIALRVGYANAQTLLKVFKKIEGVTPSGYKHLYKRDENQ